MGSQPANLKARMTGLGGWWRLWIMASVLWGLFVAANAIDAANKIPHFVADAKSSRDNPFASGAREEEAAKLNAVIAEALVLWIVPPVLVLGLAFSGHWVYRGFKPRSHAKD